jgi:hypothetical protein
MMSTTTIAKIKVLTRFTAIGTSSSAGQTAGIDRQAAMVGKM